MKLRLPNKLIAAIVAAASPVLFSTLSTATLGAAAVATLSQQAMAAEATITNSTTTIGNYGKGDTLTYDLSGVSGNAYLNGGNGFTTLADIVVVNMSLNNGNSGAVYCFQGDISGSGPIEFRSGKSPSGMTLKFDGSQGGSMSDYSGNIATYNSGNMKLEFVSTTVGNESSAGTIATAVGTTYFTAADVYSTAVTSPDINIGAGTTTFHGSNITSTGAITIADGGSMALDSVSQRTGSLTANDITISSANSKLQLSAGTSATVNNALQVNGTLNADDGATLALKKGISFGSDNNSGNAVFSGGGSLVYDGTDANVNINFRGADISGWNGDFVNKSQNAVTMTINRAGVYVNADINSSPEAVGAVNLAMWGDKYFTGTSRVNDVTHNINHTLHLRDDGHLTVTGRVLTGRLVVGERAADRATVFTLDGQSAYLNNNGTAHSYGARVQGYGTFVLKNGATQTLTNFDGGNTHLSFVADGAGSTLTLNAGVTTLNNLTASDGGTIVIGADITANSLTSDGGSFSVSNAKTLTISTRTDINQALVATGEGSVSLGGAVYVNVPQQGGEPGFTYSGTGDYEGSGFRTYKQGSYTVTTTSDKVTIADNITWHMGAKDVTANATYEAGTLSLNADTQDSSRYYVNSDLAYNSGQMDSAYDFEVAAGKTFTATGQQLGSPNGRGAAVVVLNEGSALKSTADTDIGSRQIEALSLVGDAKVIVDGNIGVVNNNYNSSTLNLNGNTLSLERSAGTTGDKTFYLVTTTVSEGTIKIGEGVILEANEKTLNAGINLSEDTVIDNGGIVRINTNKGNVAAALLTQTIGSGDMILRQNATINGNVTTKSTGTLTIENGATLTFGTGDGQRNSMASFSQVVLNNGKLYWNSAASSINNLTVGSSNGTLQIFDINASPIVLEGTTTLNGNLTLTNNNWGEKLTIRKLTGTGNFANTSTSAADTLTVTMEEVANYTGTISTTNPKTIINATLGEQVNMSGVNVSGGTISLTTAPALVGSAPAVGTATVQDSGKLNLSGAMTLEHIYMDAGTLNIKSGNIDVTQLMFSKQGSNVGTLNVETGATLHITGTQSTASEGGSGGSFEICNWAANNEINISGSLVSEAGFTMEGNGNPVVNVKNGGLLTMNAGLKAHNRLGGATAHVNIENGGTLQVANLNDSTNSHIDLQVSDGGTVEGISANTQMNQQININGDNAAINLKAASEKKLVVGSGIVNETATLNLIGGGTVRLAAESAVETVSADANTTAELAQLSAQSVTAGDAVSISGKDGNVTMVGVKLNSSALTKSDTAVGAVTGAAISVGNNSTVSISDVTMTDSDITVAEGATTNLSNAQLNVTAGGHSSTFDGVTVGENVSVDLRSGATMSFLNQATGVNLKDLYIGSGATVNAFIGTPTAEEIAAAQNGTNSQVEADLSVSGTLSTYDSQATLNANLTMKNGSTINVAVNSENYMAGGLTMGSTVTFEQGGKMNLSNNIINGLNSLTIGEGLTLFSGVDAFNINGKAYDANLTYKASDFFNLSNSDVAVTRPWDFVVKFDDPAGSQQGGAVYLWMETPEPATATLSLLALAALAARRRRH